jgi:ATP-dependent Zn protease
MRAIVDKQHERATQMLSEHRSVLDNMTRVLIERETIYTEEVEMLMQGKSYTEVIEYMDSQDDTAEKAYKRLR